MRLKILGFIVAICFFQDCAAAQERMLLNPTDRENLKIIDLYNLIAQDELRPAMESASGNIVATAILGVEFGGFFGAAIPLSIQSQIDKSRGIKSHEITDPLFQVADSFDYRSIFAKEINAVFGSEYRLHVERGSAESVMLTGPQLRHRIMGLAEGEGLLFLSTTYGLMGDSKKFSVETVAVIFKKNKGWKESENPVPIYVNELNYISDAVGNGASDSINSWQANDAKLYENVLVESAREIAKLLTYDLKNDTAFECANTTIIDSYRPSGSIGRTKGLVLEQKNDRIVLRSSFDGSLYSIGGQFVISPNKNSKCAKILKNRAAIQ